VLIDMAIAGQRNEDVLRWYDAMRAGKKQPSASSAWTSEHSYADRVAATVAKSHPERTLEIYHQRAEENLPRAHVSAYEAVAAISARCGPFCNRSIARPNGPNYWRISGCAIASARGSWRSSTSWRPDQSFSHGNQSAERKMAGAMQFMAGIIAPDHALNWNQRRLAAQTGLQTFLDLAESIDLDITTLNVHNSGHSEY
jgi:hypothetical protein